MKMFLTRIGFGSKAVITGDITQIDLPARKVGPAHAMECCEGVDGIGFTFFDATRRGAPPAGATHRQAYEAPTSHADWLAKLTQAFSSDPRTRKDLIDILEVAAENDVIDSETHDIMQGALEVAHMQVRDVMVPRPQMVCLHADDAPDEIVRRVIDSGHSRYPVIGESSDDVLGIVMAKDMLTQLFSHGRAASTSRNCCARRRSSRSKRLNVLLREFRQQRNHIAVVIDEYGGVAGLVTIEDVLEQIVGDIEDEHDRQQDSFIKKLSENDYLIKR
jgi:magnesium and cobalt transporter